MKLSYQRARSVVSKLRGLPDNHIDVGWAASPNSVLDATLDVLEKFQNDGCPLPNDVYPMPDGNVTVEWQFSDRRVVRVEVEGPGRADVMVSYKHREPRFFSLKW